MGQYYYPVNIDRKEYLHPHKFRDGLKLMEFALDPCGTMAGLAILLADGNGQGGGDLCSDNPIIGSWAGDRIIIAGDYAEPKRFLPKHTKKELQQAADKCFTPGFQNPDNVNLHTFAQVHCKDISNLVIKALCDDSYFAKTFKKKI